MTDFKHINCEQLKALQAKNSLEIVDIRDQNSFLNRHIKGAFHLTNSSLNEFVSQTEYETPVVVVCYHGISSQGAAQYIAQQGFTEVYSLDGGFEAWHKSFPEHTEAG
ncbi:thiosulfate sulfurtransferase GlpE [Gayadomonas joobiniege]|uniref:thiosulfate sulfurtransferase GlpE n=1 Tax=Gayadomonas joobiniege TaxID=1234606 RepID=UPI00036FBFBC|nr:thiosulfate sulfurtransferase GlpE [Gayadomonas joobiniege]